MQLHPSSGQSGSTHLFTHTPKALVQTLPRVVFEGRIVVIQSQAEADKAVRYLLTQPIVGIDTETRPTFHKGPMNKVALLQVSTLDICFLFRLNFTGLTGSIVSLLESRDVRKVGLSLGDDTAALLRRGDFRPRAFIDLQACAREMGIEDMSLQKLYANVFRQRISKNAQLSNWEADVLSDSQKLYAATDAYTCLQLYGKLTELRRTGNYVIEEPPAGVDSAAHTA
ncbi:MAG: 3'-5' exonuclease [Alloprevotella sp.]